MVSTVKTPVECLDAKHNTARYGNVTRPQSRSDTLAGTESATQRARRRWGQGRLVAQRAGHDNTSEDEEDEDVAVKRQQKLQREKYAKTMVCSKKGHMALVCHGQLTSTIGPGVLS